MPELSEWLKLMLAEIARKGEDDEKAREEEKKRQSETTAETRSVKTA